MGATETETKPEEKLGFMETLAVSQYFKIRLRESTKSKIKFGPQYVGINDYAVRIPREREVLVAAPLVAVLNESSEGFEYIDHEGNPAHSRRDDLEMKIDLRPISPQEAHVARVTGMLNGQPIMVFPQKLKGKALDAVGYLSADATKKGK